MARSLKAAANLGTIISKGPYRSRFGFITDWFHLPGRKKDFAQSGLLAVWGSFLAADWQFLRRRLLWHLPGAAGPSGRAKSAGLSSEASG